MSLPRIFVTTKLHIKQKISLGVNASKHILQVLRLKPKDQLIVFNNPGGEFKASISAINKHEAIVFLEEFISRQNESPLAIHLGQGVSRGDKMDFTIQKTVELGVNAITPLFTAYCNVKLDAARLAKRHHHWQGIAINAAEQSGRCYVPQVFPGKDLTTWLNTTSSDLCLVLEPSAPNKLSALTFKERPTQITLLVGPEGGLSREEVTLAKEKYFLPVTLGPRILRTETAALTAISILQAKWGDL